MGITQRTKRAMIVATSGIGLAALAAALFIGQAGDTHAATPSAASPSTISMQQAISTGRSHHFGGLVVPQVSNTTGGVHKPPPEPAFNGAPPLLFNGAGGGTCFFQPCDRGNVMMTAATGPLVVVPIYWSPAGYPMSAAYTSLINSYLGDVAQASGTTQNTYSVSNEYYGNNGQIHYNVRLGPVLTDTTPITSGCNLAKADTSGIYADGSGYSACVDDAQLQAEVDNITAANGLPHDLGHIYVLYLPKGVESCFNSGSTKSTAGGQACTINHQPTAAYCAYHSTDLNSAVYANMAYPIYASPVGYTCGSDARFPVLESPNGNPDADTEISPTSHEILESVTDPDVETGWYDAAGFENGDECAYIFGATSGTPGGFFNQVINGGHFLTQEMPSNNLFKSSGGTAACEQGS